MRTLEEFCTVLRDARNYGGFGLEPYFESLRQHDADQRVELAKKDEEIAKLYRLVKEEAQKVDMYIAQRNKVSSQYIKLQADLDRGDGRGGVGSLHVDLCHGVSCPYER